MPCFKTSTTVLIVVISDDFMNYFYGFRSFHRRAFLLLLLLLLLEKQQLLLQLFSQNIRTIFLCKQMEEIHFSVRMICKYCLQNYVFIRTTLFLVNSCIYLENFLFVWKTILMYLYLFCKGINKLFTKLKRRLFPVSSLYHSSSVCISIFCR